MINDNSSILDNKLSNKVIYSEFILNYNYKLK